MTSRITSRITIFFGTLLLGMALLVMSLWVMNSTQKASGAAPQGMRTLVASSTVKANVGTSTPVTIFSGSSCAGRAITTVGEPIMFTIASSTDLDQTVVPTATFGHLQAASTTVMYDAGTWGCDVWQAFGYASTTISVTEFGGFR